MPVRIDGVDFGTALFPKDGRYLIPVKNAVRRTIAIEVDDVVTVGLTLRRE